MSCKHTIGTAVDWNGCCISCGADLNPIAIAEARKKTKKKVKKAKRSR